MTSNRSLATFVAAPLLAVPVLGAAVSGGDLGFVAFLTGLGGGTLAAIFALAFGITRWQLRWQRDALEATARALGGEVERNVAGEARLRLPGVVVDYLALPETAGGGDGGELTPLTRILVPRARGGPSVEVRWVEGSRRVRWVNRWREIFGRSAPEDPAPPEAAVIAAIAPDARLLYQADGVAVALPGNVIDPAELAHWIELLAPALREL